MSGAVHSHKLFLIVLFLLYTLMPAPQFFISFKYTCLHTEPLEHNYCGGTEHCPADKGTTAAPCVSLVMEYISVFINSLKYPFKYPQRFSCKSPNLVYQWTCLWRVLCHPTKNGYFLFGCPTYYLVLGPLCRKKGAIISHVPSSSDKIKSTFQLGG